jgi:hypothetical protein
MKYQMGDFGQQIRNEELGILENLITPDVKQSIITAAKNGAIEGVKYVWEEYKAPILLVGTVVAITFILENMANAKILGQKG